MLGPSDSLRDGIEFLGQNPDDPRSVWSDSKFQLNHFSFNQVLAGNLPHLVLLFVSFFLVLFRGRSSVSRKPLWYGLGIALGFVFMSAVLLWSPFEARYHLADFVLGSALIGVALEWHMARWLATTIGFSVILYGLVFATSNNARSLGPWGHHASAYKPWALGYFSDQHEAVASTYLAVSNFVNHLDCKDIGIDSYISDPAYRHAPSSLWVYPLFALIDGDGQKRTLWYTGVQNISAKYIQREPSRSPCAVICLDCAGVRNKFSEYQKLGMQPTIFDNIVVFSSLKPSQSAGNDR